VTISYFREAGVGGWASRLGCLAQGALAFMQAACKHSVSKAAFSADGFGEGDPQLAENTHFRGPKSPLDRATIPPGFTALIASSANGRFQRRQERDCSPQAMLSRSHPTD